MKSPITAGSVELKFCSPLKNCNTVGIYDNYKPSAAQRRRFLRVTAVCLTIFVGIAMAFAVNSTLDGHEFCWNTFLVGSAWGILCTLIAMACLSLFALIANDIKSLRH